VGGRFTFVSRRAGDRGALRAGVHPFLLPGGRRVDDESERGEVEVAWGGSIPATPGRDAWEIVEAAARNEIDVLYVIGVDLLADFPDAKLARRALENVRYKVVQDIRRGQLANFADVMLPAAPFLERDGHLTSWEGRGQRLRRTRGPVGLARSDWEIFQGLSEVIGKDLGFRTLDDLHEEMGALMGPREGTARSSAAPPSEPPGSDAHGTITLFTYPLLVDEGRLSDGAGELKEALEDQSFVEVHPDDAERLGLADGEPTQLRTDAGQAILPVHVTANIAAGSVFVPFNNPGLRANTLLSGAFTTTVSIEPANGG